jgi:Xaa-Pro aminopeptidase
MWDRARLLEQEFRQRLGLVRDGMRQQGLGLLLVYGDSRRYGDLAFVSHFIPKNRGALAIIPLDGEPALVVQEPSRNNPFSKTLTWIDEVHSVGQFAQGLSEAVKARALKPKNVGLVAVKEQLNIRECNALVKVLDGARISDCSDLLSSLRVIKSPAEIALLQESSEILSEALSLFENEVKPGQKEYEIMALLDREARRRGAEDFRFLIARSSQPEIGLRPASSSTVEKGEALLISVAASHQRCWAELGRTFCLGSPPQQLFKSHGLAKNMFQKLAESIKAGASAAAAGAWLKEVPFPGVRESLQAYGLGNGIGLEMIELPYLGADGSVPIQSGMVLTLRVCMTGKDSGCALIAQPYQVTESGLEPLVKPVTDLISVGN